MIDKAKAPDFSVPDESARVNACVQKIKKSGKITFVYLRLRGDVIKTVCLNNSPDISGLFAGMYITAELTAVKEIRAENGIDIRMTGFTPISAPDVPTKAAPSLLSPSDAAQKRAVLMRNPEFMRVIKLRSGIMSLFCGFMDENGFIRVSSPAVSLSTEKPSFRLDYFGETAYLSDSPQPYMTAATAALDRTYEIAHSFLAKKYNSTRHLSEYTSLNFQLGYIDGAEDIMSVLTEFLRYAVPLCGGGNVTDIPEYDFPRALSMLKKSSQPDLDPTDIKKLCALEKSSSGCDFVYVTGFPPDKRPFYSEDYSCFDLYYNGLKIASGSKNISDYGVQLEKAEKMNISMDMFKAYSDALKYGIMPYGGCVIGLERFTAKLCGLDSAKDASLFVRDLHTLSP